jgi:glycosyltransferase involved in cell wall biosynthesis
MIHVSAIIITLNEEDRIGETISSLQFCDEILVVDSGSSDRTREVAAACGVRVLERDWTGYSDQKNHGAENASHDWVLSIDADERPSIELANEIRRWKDGSSNAPTAVAFSMPRRVSYLGSWIRHSGWYPDRKARLYDRRHARWKGDYVHEELSADGPVARFRGDLYHFPYRSIEEHHATIDRYTALAAEKLKNRGRRFNPLRLALGPPLYFFKAFLFRRGFLDGIPGLRIAYMGARYVFIREFRMIR